MASNQTAQADFTELSPTAWKVLVSVPDEKFRKALDKLYGDGSLTRLNDGRYALNGKHG